LNIHKNKILLWQTNSKKRFPVRSISNLSLKRKQTKKRNRLEKKHDFKLKLQKILLMRQSLPIEKGFNSN